MPDILRKIQSRKSVHGSGRFGSEYLKNACADISRTNMFDLRHHHFGDVVIFDDVPPKTYRQMVRCEIKCFPILTMALSRAFWPTILIINGL